MAVCTLRSACLGGFNLIFGYPRGLLHLEMALWRAILVFTVCAHYSGGWQGIPPKSFRQSSPGVYPRFYTIIAVHCIGSRVGGLLSSLKEPLWQRLKHVFFYYSCLFISSVISEADYISFLKECHQNDIISHSHKKDKIKDLFRHNSSVRKHFPITGSSTGQAAISEDVINGWKAKVEVLGFKNRQLETKMSRIGLVINEISANLTDLISDQKKLHSMVLNFQRFGAHICNVRDLARKLMTRINSLELGYSAQRRLLIQRGVTIEELELVQFRMSEDLASGRNELMRRNAKISNLLQKVEEMSEITETCECPDLIKTVKNLETTVKYQEDCLLFETRLKMNLFSVLEKLNDDLRMKNDIINDYRYKKMYSHHSWDF